MHQSPSKLILYVFGVFFSPKGVADLNHSQLLYIGLILHIGGFSPYDPIMCTGSLGCWSYKRNTIY